MAVTLSPTPPTPPIPVELAYSKPSGPAAAAVISGSLGLLAMAIAHTMADGSEAVKTAVHNLGKLWMPGAQGIGPYSGKETIAVLVWLGSWAIMHFMLRNRQVNLARYGVAFLVLMGLSTTIFWQPVTHLLVQIFYGK
jgi:hypothetical protein